MSDDTTNADATAEAPATPKRPQASVSRRRCDGGITRLGGSGTISKADARVEAYGAIDELSTVIGVAWSGSRDAEIPDVARGLVQRFDALVARFEAEPNVLRDRSIPGEFTESAPFDMARAMCRRAERANVRYVTSGGVVQPTVLEYLNRLPRNGVDTCLRTAEHPGPPWSRW